MVALLTVSNCCFCLGLAALPRKGRDPEFNFKKLAFVQEASGKQTEELVAAAQSSVNNARNQSLQAGFNLFATSPENDHVLHEKYVASAEMNGQRNRSVLVHSLEAGFLVDVYHHCALVPDVFEVSLAEDA